MEDAVTHKLRRARQDTGRYPERDRFLPALADCIAAELKAVSGEAVRQRAALLLEMGHLEEVVLGDGESSLAHYRRAHHIDPSYVPAHRALARRLFARGHWDELIQVLESELEVVSREEHRSALLAHLGEIHAFHLEDTNEAVRYLRAALDLNPRDRHAAMVLRRIHARLEQWDELLELLRQMASVAASDEDQARLLVEMAEISEGRLGRLGHAEGLYARALALAPECEAALLALRRLYSVHRRWRALRDLLTGEGRRQGDPDQRFADLCRAARISEHHLQDDARAAELLEEAAALRPTHPLPVQALTAIYQRTGNYQSLAAALGRHVRLVDSAAERASLCYRHGRVCEDWLDQPEQAASAYREALREQPGHEATMRSLAALHGRLGRWQELLDLELLRAERSPGAPRRAEGYLRAAVICEKQLQDPRRAVDLYERSYRLQPKLASAFRALQRLYHKAGRWDSLAELYEREAALLDDRPMATSLLRSAAWIHEQQLDDRQRAISVLEKLEGTSSDNHETMISLARLYEETGRMDRLAEVLQTWAAATTDARLSSELRRHLAELQEGPLRKPEQAVELYRQILDQTPGDRPTLDRLKAYFERTGRWADLVKTLRLELEQIREPGERAHLLLQVGQLSQHKLGLVDEAIAALDEAIAADPGFTPAQQVLEDLLRNQGLWDRLVELLEAGVQAINEPVPAASKLVAAAEICEEQFKDGDKASRLYERALELDPRMGPAFAGLERIHLDAGDGQALEELYKRGASGGASKPARVCNYLRLGRLLDNGDDDAPAVQAFEAALAVQPDQPDALLSLAKIHRRHGRWEQMCKALARITGLGIDAVADLAAVHECASVVETHLSDRGDAGPLYERLLEGDPANTIALSSLERRAYARKDRASLISLARLQREAGGQQEQLASLCLRAATLMLIQEGPDLSAATEILRQGREACPEYLPVLWLLRLMDEHLGNWKAAAALRLEEGALAANRSMAHASLLQAGDIFLKQFDDREAAQRAYEQVFAEDPANEEGFARLARMLADAEEWRPLADAFRRRLAALSSDHRPPVLMDLAVVYRDHLLDPVAAADVLEELLVIDPEHGEAIFLVTELCVALKRWRDAEGYLDRLAAVSEDSAVTRRGAMVKRARILEEQLRDPAAALAVLRDLLAEFPNDREALTRSAAIYQASRDWENLVAVLDELVRSGPAAERIHHLVNLAEVYGRCLRDDQRAQGAMRRAAAIAVQTGAGIDRISEHFERRRDHKGLVAFWGKALEGLPPEGSPGSVPVRLARARVMSGLVQAAEAEAEIRRALEYDPGSVEARLELAALQLMNNDLGEATTEYMRALDSDPFCLDAFRGLYQVCERRGDLQRAAGAAQAACFVASDEVPERPAAARAAAAVEAALESGRVTPEETLEDLWHLVVYPGEPQVAPEVLAMLGDYLAQVFPQQLQRYEERITGGSELAQVSEQEPLGRQCQLVAQAMGVETYQCWTGELPAVPAVVLHGAVPRVVIDSRLAAQVTGGRLRFILGRALAEVVTRSFYLTLLDPATVELLFMATVELFVRGYATQLGRGREAEELSRKVSKALPRKVRKRLEEPARAYAEVKPIAATRWATTAGRSADRAGLLVCGDAEAALAQLRDERASQEVMGELLRFVVGPHLYEARRRLGLVG